VAGLLAGVAIQEGGAAMRTPLTYEQQVWTNAVNEAEQDLIRVCPTLRGENLTMKPRKTTQIEGSPLSSTVERD
jgi:hypothetical protein